MIRLAVLATAALFTLSTGAQAGKCFLSSASAVGATKEVADALSKTALSTAIAGKGVTGKGKVVTKCSGQFPLVTCKSSQRTCGK